MRTTYMYRVSAGFAHAAAILGAGWMLMFGTAPAHADQLPREFVGNYCGTTSDPNNGSPIEFYRKSPRCKKGAAYVRLTSDRLFMPDEVTEIACVLDHIISVNRHGTHRLLYLCDREKWTSEILLSRSGREEIALQDVRNRDP
jgi:hypothetical protein